MQNKNAFKFLLTSNPMNNGVYISLLPKRNMQNVYNPKSTDS